MDPGFVGAEMLLDHNYKYATVPKGRNTNRSSYIYSRKQLPARRYASVYEPLSQMSVCLSVTSRSLIETDGRIELVLAWRLRSTYPTLRSKNILVSPKKYFPL